MEKIIYTIPLSEFTDIIRKCIKEEMSLSDRQINEEEYIRVEEAVKLFNVSKVTLYKWRKKNILPYRRVSSRIYFKKSELLAILNGNNKHTGVK